MDSIDSEPMDDLDKYISDKKKQRPDFAKNCDIGYEQFKLTSF